MQVIDEFQTAQEFTRLSLRNNPESRNDDKVLILDVWREQGLLTERDGKLMIRKSDVRLLAQPETITRVRRELQNDRGEFLPTNPQVLARRHIKEKIVREYYGANTGIFQEFQNHKYGVE
mgnify:CR=1 FL=1